MAERKKYNFGNATKILANGGTVMNDGTITASLQPSDGLKTEEEIAESTPMQERLKQLEVQTTGAKAFNFKYIPREKLVFHTDNHYPMEEIQKLGETILRFGLIHNLEVLYEEETDTYVIESGERRTRAIDELVERFKEAPDSDPDYQMYLLNVKQYVDEGYPCNVKRQSSLTNEEMTEKERVISQIESKIRLRLANEEVRNQDPARTKAAVMELTALYTQLNKLLERKDKINVNEMVAKEMGISKSQVKNYKATEQLIPELRELFENKGITLKESVTYSRLSEEDQKQIVALMQEGGDKNELKLLSEKLAATQAEVRKKEAELHALENEKTEALEKAAAAKRDAAELEEKIRAELEAEAEEKGEAEQEKIKGLQNQLEAMKQNVGVYEQKKKELEEAHAKKIAELEKQLAEKEEKRNAIPSESTRKALQIEGIISSIAGQIKQFERVLQEYESIYDESSEERAPDDYRNSLIRMLQESGIPKEGNITVQERED